MTRGEGLKCIVDYDLFDNNINGLVGIFASYSESNRKYLVYYPDFEEWAELERSQFIRIDPDFIPDFNAEFISRVKKLGD